MNKHSPNTGEKIKQKLDYLIAQTELEGMEIVKRDCKVFRLFVRRDGFKDSDTLEYDELTKYQLSILIGKEWKIPIKKRLKLMADEQLPPYMENDTITFYPVKWVWNKDTLEIMYEER